MTLITTYDILIDEEYMHTVSLSSVNLKCGWYMQFFVTADKLDSIENDAKVMVF
jgi:hypothetical protein